jgi:prefoldin subunit 4
MPFSPQEHSAHSKLRYRRYKIGDSVISLPLPEVQEMLSTSTEKIEEEVAAVEEKLSTIREEMSQLKVELYARFGRSINLET